jgi:hypothetical protein
MIGFTRKITPMKITKDGKVVGEIDRIATGHFALRLDGVYWNAVGQPTRTGGRTQIGFRTLREARERAYITLA